MSVPVTAPFGLWNDWGEAMPGPPINTTSSCNRTSYEKAAGRAGPPFSVNSNAVGRLVKDEHIRTVQQPCREHYLLLVASGQLAYQGPTTFCREGIR